MSKPHISGSYQQKPWAGWHYDTPLFSEWSVSWEEPAGCGHDSCGVDWVQQSFATWDEALRFALALVV